MKLHGVVTGLQAFGVFVGFYGGVAGLIPNKELDLLPGQQAGDVYSVGQLIRVQVRPSCGYCFVELEALMKSRGSCPRDCHQHSPLKMQLYPCLLRTC